MANVIESRSGLGCRLRVEFLWQGDRFGHVIRLVEGETVRSILTSVEETSLDSWPSSPVFQQLHIENRSDLANDCRVALLVGMAGRNHWSLSVEPDLNAPAFIFDVACRVDASKPCELRSTYHSEIALRRLEDSIAIFSSDKPWSLTLRADQDLSTTLKSNAADLVVSPQQNAGSTRRWKYRVEVTPST